MSKTVAIVGGGVMGETLAAGLLRAGTQRASLVIAERREDRAEELRQRLGVDVVATETAIERADTLMLVVKPQDMPTLLTAVGATIPTETLVVSLAAGVQTQAIEKFLSPGTPVVRVMPNTPALVDEGMSAVSAGSSATPEHLAETEALLAAIGHVIRVPEQQQDAVTAISGSGPAYFFFIVEAMIEAGVHLGLPRTTATELALQTAYGSAKMLRETGEHPTVLREQVTSPGGTTAAALSELEQHGVRAAFMSALAAARDRSVALGQE